MIRALFVDAAGTLLKPREPVGVSYARVARRHGQEVDPAAVQPRFRAALHGRAGQRQEGDGRAYWRGVVAESVGVDDEALFEELYALYAEPRAWWVDTDALRGLGGIARRGVRLGIVSNWDTRLRSLYTRMALDRMFPWLVCSAEVELEKPDPAIFHLACELVGVEPAEAVHVGDDPERDVAGASRAGLGAVHYEEDAGWGEALRQLDRLYLGRAAGLYGRPVGA